LCGGFQPEEPLLDEEPDELELELDDELLEEEEDDELDELDEPPVEVLVEPPLVDVEPPLVEVDPPLVEVEPPLVDVELPPVEVELPPVDVELPPVEVELPPVEVEPPLVEVDPPVVVEEMTTLPPPLLPPKKPPKKPPMPPPQPPLPPATMIGPLLPPDMLGISETGRSSGNGAICVRDVTTVGVGVGRGPAIFTTLRGGAFTGARCAVLIGLRFTWLTTAGRDASASCRAPPPMIAPPAAQAQSFAKAILTDIVRPLFRTMIAAEVLAA